MSRQTERAAARDRAKVSASEDRVAARAVVRKAKGLTPLSRNQAAGYPPSLTVPAAVRGKTYSPNGNREVARRSRQAVAA